MDKDISVIKNPFSFEHEEKSDSKIMTIEEKQKNKDKVNTDANKHKNINFFISSILHHTYFI